MPCLQILHAHSKSAVSGTLVIYQIVSLLGKISWFDLATIFAEFMKPECILYRQLHAVCYMLLVCVGNPSYPSPLHSEEDCY